MIKHSAKSLLFLYAFVTPQLSFAALDSLQVLSIMDFGQLEGGATSGHAQLGTDGSVNYTSQLSGDSLVSVAEILIIGDPGTVVDIGCRGSAGKGILMA